MLDGRPTLVVSMVVVAPVLWWGGVNGAAHRARAALPPGDPTLPGFVDNYRSAGLTMVGLFALINLLVILAFVPAARHLREPRTGTLIRAVFGVVLVTGLAVFEHRFSPVTGGWSGDPDARSLVKDHATAWHPAIAACWIAVNTAAAASVPARLSKTPTTHNPT